MTSVRFDARRLNLRHRPPEPQTYTSDTVGQQAGPDSVELARLRDELRSCRLELAERQRELEVLQEARHEVLRRCETAEEQARLLSTFLDERLTAADLASGSTTAAPSRLRRRGGTSPDAQEDADVATLQASALLDGPWYLREYPQVAATGLSPARHYLRHGADAKLDPGPSFSTEDYLQRHPELAASGENPLLHHLHGRSEQDPAEAIVTAR
jgi:hypothetical protein